MSEATHVQVDNGQRIRLPDCAKPGEVYAIETPQPGEILLRLVDVPANPARPTYEEALRAVRGSNLRFAGGYDELRAIAREA